MLMDACINVVRLTDVYVSMLVFQYINSNALLACKWSLSLSGDLMIFIDT